MCSTHRRLTKGCKLVQAVTGLDAGAMVSSELAAMFDCIVIPTLLKHYEPDTKPRRFKKLCEEFAQRIGLPREEWPRVTFPAAISFDNDKRHPHIRKTMLTPRFTDEELETKRKQAIAEHFKLEAPNKRQRGAGVSTASFGYQLCGAAMRQRAVNEALARYRAQHGVDFWEECKWELARQQPEGWVCLLPQQIMPLCENSADLHCPVEHMVGTVKGGVRTELLDMDMNDAALWKGATYQRLIGQVVQLRGNGERGLKHIQRSVEKWPHVAAILAADKSEKLHLRYVFGDGGRNPNGKKCEVHEVWGTAGEWIRDTRWT